MSKSNSMIKQASILAIAGLLTRIIGLLYRSPLTALIGDEGMGYYATAYNIYAVILLISSYAIPTAISKLIAEKLVVHQYNNAKKIFHCAIIYIIVIGGSASLLAFLLAPLLTFENAVFALRILCPAIFLSGLLGVLRGYFQAYSTTVFTSVSQILEQIFNAIVSILAAWIFIQPYLEAGGSKMASIGAGGSALGTVAGVIIALIYMFVAYMKRKNNDLDLSEQDETVDSSSTIFKSILSIVTPIIVATCICNLIATIDMYIFYGIMGFKGASTIATVTLFGVYANKFMVLMNVPIALPTSMSAASIPEISSSYAIRDYKQTIEHINSSISVTMLMMIPATIGMAVLAYPIMGTIYPQPETLNIATSLLVVGSPAIVFLGLSTLTNGILQAMGDVKTPLHNATISLITHIILLAICLVIVPCDIALYMLAICNVVYGIQMCYMNNAVLKKRLHFKTNIKRTYLLPLTASIIMGIIVYIIYKLLFMLTHMVFIPLIISVIIGIIVYFALIIYLYQGHDEELMHIPYMDKILRRIRR